MRKSDFLIIILTITIDINTVYYTAINWDKVNIFTAANFRSI